MLRPNPGQGAIEGKEPAPAGAALQQFRWHEMLQRLLTTFPLPEEQGKPEGQVEELTQAGPG